MYTCNCGSNNTSNNSSNIDSNHVNAFVDMNGVPYLVAEYLDTNNFQQIDRSLIKSEVFVDQSEAMRAVVDISIDDIGKRASDGLPAIVGNNTKQKNLLKMISDNSLTGEEYNREIGKYLEEYILKYIEKITQK